MTRVFPTESFHEKVQELVSNMAKLPPKVRNFIKIISPSIYITLQSLMKSKQLLRDVNRDILEKANQAECDLLEERWVSDECIQAILAFMQRKQK